MTTNTIIFDKDTNATIAEVGHVNSMTLDELISLAGGEIINDVDDPRFDPDGANVIIDGRRYWYDLIEAREAGEAVGATMPEETTTDNAAETITEAHDAAQETTTETTTDNTAETITESQETTTDNAREAALAASMARFKAAIAARVHSGEYNSARLARDTRIGNILDAYKAGNITRDEGIRLVQETTTDNTTEAAKEADPEAAEDVTETTTDNATEAHETPEAVTAVQVDENTRVEWRPEDDRIAIIFQDRPDEEIRARLKAERFGWSRRRCAWLGRMTEDSERAAERALGLGYCALDAMRTEAEEQAETMTNLGGEAAPAAETTTDRAAACTPEEAPEAEHAEPAAEAVTETTADSAAEIAGMPVAEFSRLVSQEYQKMYNSGKIDYKAVDAHDRHSKDHDSDYFKALITLDKYRQDYISSDREAAAFCKAYNKAVKAQRQAQKAKETTTPEAAQAAPEEAERIAGTSMTPDQFWAAYTREYQGRCNASRGSAFRTDAEQELNGAAKEAYKDGGDFAMAVSQAEKYGNYNTGELFESTGDDHAQNAIYATWLRNNPDGIKQALDRIETFWQATYMSAGQLPAYARSTIATHQYRLAIALGAKIVGMRAR